MEVLVSAKTKEDIIDTLNFVIDAIQTDNFTVGVNYDDGLGVGRWCVIEGET